MPFNKLIEGHLVCLRPRGGPVVTLLQDGLVTPAQIALVGLLSDLNFPEFTVSEDGSPEIDAEFVHRFRSDENEELVVRLSDSSVWEVDQVAAPALVV